MDPLPVGEMRHSGVAVCIVCLFTALLKHVSRMHADSVVLRLIASHTPHTHTQQGAAAV